jgi:hypothetical protein
MEVYLNISFIAIFGVAKDTSSVFYESIDKKAKRDESETKAHIGLREQVMCVEVIARCQNGDGYQ